MFLAVIVLCPIVAALAVGLGVVWQRARAGRRQLAAEMHAHALALDRRADAMDERLDQLELGLRLVRLGDQIEHARRRGLLGAEAADRLAALAAAWRVEGLEAGARTQA